MTSKSANKTQRIEVATDKKTKNLFVSTARAEGMDLSVWIRFVLLREVKRIRDERDSNMLKSVPEGNQTEVVSNE